MNAIEQLAPAGIEVIEYDRQHLTLYAALLEANDAGWAWQDAAQALMYLDASVHGAEACWRSHLERARWIVGEGLGAALKTFGERPKSVR